jgi:hypothetical protein
MIFFMSGHAHVYYGAVLIVGLSIAGMELMKSRVTVLPLIFLLIAIIAAGIFVDVWVHGYRH